MEILFDCWDKKEWKSFYSYFSNNIGKDKVKSCISPHTGFLSFGWCRLILHLFSPSSSPYLLKGGETLETFALSSYLFSPQA